MQGKELKSSFVHDCLLNSLSDLQCKIQAKGTSQLPQHLQALRQERQEIPMQRLLVIVPHPPGFEKPREITFTDQNQLHLLLVHLQRLEEYKKT